MSATNLNGAQLRKAHVRGVRAVGAFEFAKGVLVLLAGLGLLSIAHSDIYVEDIAVNLLWVLHISTSLHISRIFLEAAARLDDLNALSVAVVAALYSTVRFIEAYGLWRVRAWAEWFALLSGLVYVPLEIYELARHQTAVRWTLLWLNIAIVVYMAYLRLQTMRGTVPQGEGPAD